MTYLKELFGQVFGSLLRNKLRSFLTMAGIAWGIASIVIIVAMGDGFKEGQRNNMRGLGENIVILFGGRTAKQAGGQRAGRRIRLTYDDVDVIRRECWMVEYAIGEIESTNRGTSSYNSGAFDTDGVEPDFNKLRNVAIAEGRWFSDDDDKQGRRVAIIGSRAIRYPSRSSDYWRIRIRTPATAAWMRVRSLFLTRPRCEIFHPRKLITSRACWMTLSISRVL